jgi:HlyD family secretion protein
LNIVKVKYVMLLSFTVAICSIIYLICFFISNSAIKVNTVKLIKAEIKSTVSCSGTIQSIKVSDIYYSIALKATDIKVNIGDTVSAGQTLMDVDTTSTVQAFDNLNQKSNTTSSSTSVSTPQTDLTDITSLLNQNKGSIPTSAYNTILQNYQNQVTNNVTDSISNNSSVNSSNTDYPEIPSFVKAPISGVVTSINVSDGDFSVPTDPIISISDLKDLQIKAQVDEFLISKVKVGQSVIIKGDGFSSAYDGVVTQIYPVANQIVSDTGTRTVVNILITIKNPKSELKPGLTTNAAIIIDDNKKACTAPFEAINEDENNNEYVYVCKNDRVYKTEIKTGKEYDNCVEILSGLQIGDLIVVNPPQQFKNGKRVLQTIGSYNPQPSS